MKIYQELSNKLRKLSIFEFALIKWVYLFLGVLISTVYPPVVYLSIWVYIILAVIAALPLLMFTTSFPGGLKEKAKQYLSNNNPSNQVLTLISCTNFGIAIALFFPILTSFRWFYYLIIMIILAAKPFAKVFLSGDTKE